MTRPPDLPHPSPTEPTVVATKRRGIFGWLLLPLRLIGYFCLFIVIAGFLVAFGLPASDLCRSNGPGIACDSDGLQTIADFGLTILYLSVFTGIPLLLAGIGVVFLGLDIGRWLHRRLN